MDDRAGLQSVGLGERLGGNSELATDSHQIIASRDGVCGGSRGLRLRRGLGSCGYQIGAAGLQGSRATRRRVGPELGDLLFEKANLALLLGDPRTQAFQFRLGMCRSYCKQDARDGGEEDAKVHGGCFFKNNSSDQEKF